MLSPSKVGQSFELGFSSSRTLCSRSSGDCCRCSSKEGSALRTPACHACCWFLCLPNPALRRLRFPPEALRSSGGGGCGRWDGRSCLHYVASSTIYVETGETGWTCGRCTNARRGHCEHPPLPKRVNQGPGQRWHQYLLLEFNTTSLVPRPGAARRHL